MMILLGKLLLITIMITFAWSAYEACRQKDLQKRKARQAERDLDRLSHQFDALIGLDDVESIGLLLKDETTMNLIRQLIAAYQHYAETHPCVDCEPEIGRLIRLLMSGPASMAAG